MPPGGLTHDLPYPLFVFFQTDGKEKEVALQYIPGVMGPPGPQVTVTLSSQHSTTVYIPPYTCLFFLFFL